MTERPNSRKAGFALPLVLTIVTILTLVFAVALNSLVNLKHETDLEKARADFDRQAMTAETRLAFLAATEPFSAAMLNIGAPRGSQPTGCDNIAVQSTLTFDNRPYTFFETPETASPLLAEVMDEAGLFNIHYASSDQLTRFFQEWGGLGDIDAANLATEVQTYFSEITATQLHPPIVRPQALFSRVPSLADYISPRTWGQMSEKITAYPDDTRFNVNTAPPDVIALMFNVDIETATAIVDQRECTVISSLATVGLISPAPGRQYTFSNGRLRFTLIDPKTGLTYRSTLILTPNDAGRPVWVENPHTLVTTPPDDVVIDELPLFPDIPDQPS